VRSQLKICTDREVVRGHVEFCHVEIGDSRAIFDGAVADREHVDEGVVADVGQGGNGGHCRPVSVVHNIARHLGRLTGRGRIVAHSEFDCKKMSNL